jgi:hypothetical protein
MRILFALVATLSATLSCSVPAATEEICGLNYDKPESLLQEMQSDPRYQAVDGTDLYLGFVDRLDQKRTWAITTPANPAHPAVICRTLVQRQEAWVVETRVLCDGPKPACDRMVADFADLDKKMADYIKAKKEEAQE